MRAKIPFLCCLLIITVCGAFGKSKQDVFLDEELVNQLDELRIDRTKLDKSIAKCLVEIEALLNSRINKSILICFKAENAEFVSKLLKSNAIKKLNLSYDPEFSEPEDEDSVSVIEFLLVLRHFVGSDVELRADKTNIIFLSK